MRRANPKRGKSADRYDSYKGASTLAEYYAPGGSKADARFNLQCGYLTVVGRN